MPATYEPIATTTLSSAANTITFSSIGSGYTDLRLVFTGTSTNGTTLTIRFNSDSSSNYSWTRLVGTGAAAQSARTTSATEIYPVLALSSTPQFYGIDIFSYAGSTNKTLLMEDASDLNGSGRVARYVGLWRSTSAITSINLIGQYGTAPNNFDTGTTATLYGILKA